MINQEINERVALALGWYNDGFGWTADYMSVHTPEPPCYSESYNAVRSVLNFVDANRPTMTSALLNALRDVLAPRMPKNKAGSPVISDWDLFKATPREICEAFLKAVEKGKK